MSALKIIIGFWLIVFGLVMIPHTVFAESNMWGVDKNTWSAVAQNTFTLDNTLCGIESLMIGWCPYDKTPARRLSKNGEVQLVLFDKVPTGGALGEVTGAVIALYNPPTSTVQYLAGMIKDFGLGTPAYAQTVGVPGSGAGIIEPIRILWTVTRNVAYLVFIIVFLVIGFMIMFRQKINPQTVINVQTALPGLVVGLILVTFSYFIAALIIDLSFVGVQLVSQIIGPPIINNDFGNADDIKRLAQNSSAFDLFTSTMFRVNNVGDIAAGAGRTLAGNIPAWGVGAAILAVIGGIAGFFTGGVTWIPAFAAGGAAVAAFSPIILGLLVPVVLLIALFIQMFRLLFGLIGTYIQLLVATVTGPLIILSSAIPGRGGQISNWIKSLVANSLVFPAVFAAFLFAGIILGTDPGQWQVSPPLFGGLSPELLRVLIAYGILLGIPAIPEMIRTALGVKGPQGFTQAALGGFMAGFGVGQAGLGTLTGGMAAERKAYAEAVAKAKLGIGAPMPPFRPHEFWKWGIRR